MFEASAPSLFFDHLRVPYHVKARGAGIVRALPAPCESLGWEGMGAALYWPTRDRAQAVLSQHQLGSIPYFARTVDADLSSRGWERTIPITNARGEEVSAVWNDEQGNIFLPFDPGEAIRNYWSEAYLRAGRASAAGSAKRAAMWAYYRARPFVPRSAQIALRRGFMRLQRRAGFPAWPIETALHDLYARLFELLQDIAPEPIPWLAPWPKGRSWALVLTHDVETAAGYAQIKRMQEIETVAGHRSSWNFVPRRYEVADELVRDLEEDGFEVGVHGLYHDGRDLESLATLTDRLPAIRDHAERWRAVGFRSPATHRKWELMPLLGFDYDSSYPDTDPWEPVSGGCLSLLPFFNGDLVELPITLPQDHTVFVLLRRTNEELWLEKARFIRDRGGMALLITHPDYMLGDDLLEAYRRFLAEFADDGELWRALPREVASWWRRRVASRLVRSGDGWTVVGPAAEEATIRHGPLETGPTAST